MDLSNRPTITHVGREGQTLGRTSKWHLYAGVEGDLEREGYDRVRISWGYASAPESQVVSVEKLRRSIWAEAKP